MKFRNPYDAREPSKGFTCKTPSRTLQSETYATTVDYYLKRYAASGVLGDPSKINRAMYGDFTGLGDFQEMQEKINSVRNYFNSLPAGIRARFGNNANEFVSFVNDSRNTEECFKLGIFVDPNKTPEASAKAHAEQVSRVVEKAVKTDSPAKEQATA